MTSRWRIVQCDCLDCIDPSERSSYLQGNFFAAARQEPPPKCFIFFADGFISENLLNANLTPHLNGIARGGSNGFLGVRKNVEFKSENILKQLLGMMDRDGQLLPEEKLVSLQDRFKGMKVSMVTQDENCAKIGKQVGCEIFCDFNFSNDKNQLVEPQKTSQFVLDKLGIKEKTKDDENLSNGQQDEIDILILHFGENIGVEETSDSKLQWTDEVFRILNQSKKFVTEVISILLLSSNDISPISEGGQKKKLLKKGGEKIQVGKPIQLKRKGQKHRTKTYDQNQYFPSIIRPRQSFEFLGLDEVEIDEERVVLCVKKLQGVIRCDECSKVGYKECYEKGGDLAILIDRLFYEIAYKLARAPKYGA
eukprot:TRINITY_DN1670_c0_g1_i1.p2 TRINITY_DN1670_c0_g1~~TRINITY_DN1670_c0_g1_i1.p2  ORF type:complete len:365 (-),score=55.77 TRINITY_DN1670_c0_g1_i1:203-1297(-)